MMTDPIADMLTRIRNALRIKAATCIVPASKLKISVLDVLKREGYIESYEVQSEGVRSWANVGLKYGPEGEQVVTSIQRFSKPGCRRYRGKDDLPKVMGGLGVAIISTSGGVMSDRQARAQGRGGEVLCVVS